MRKIIGLYYRTTTSVVFWLKMTISGSYEENMLFSWTRKVFLPYKKQQRSSYVPSVLLRVSHCHDLLMGITWLPKGYVYIAVERDSSGIVNIDVRAKNGSQLVLYGKYNFHIQENNFCGRKWLNLAFFKFHQIMF